ncbi:hypothetical protein MTO96_009870 [Rhipicephalus appendiculatus]
MERSDTQETPGAERCLADDHCGVWGTPCWPRGCRDKGEMRDTWPRGQRTHKGVPRSRESCVCRDPTPPAER